VGICDCHPARGSPGMPKSMELAPIRATTKQNAGGGGNSRAGSVAKDPSSPRVGEERPGRGAAGASIRRIVGEPAGPAMPIASRRGQDLEQEDEEERDKWGRTRFRPEWFRVHTPRVRGVPTRSRAECEQTWHRGSGNAGKLPAPRRGKLFRHRGKMAQRHCFPRIQRYPDRLSPVHAHARFACLRGQLTG
jgi:hypothetical protein